LKWGGLPGEVSISFSSRVGPSGRQGGPSGGCGTINSDVLVGSERDPAIPEGAALGGLVAREPAQPIAAAIAETRQQPRPIRRTVKPPYYQHDQSGRCPHALDR
jgi:hypothetical protein